MLATLGYFVKYSCLYSERIKNMLKAAGHKRTTLSALIRTVADLGTRFSHGKWVKTSLTEIMGILDLSRSQTIRNLEKLVQAKIIEKISKRRGGTEIRMLVVPETDKPYSQPSKVSVTSPEAQPAPTPQPAPDPRRIKAVELRLDEIEKREGFKKNREFTRIYLMNRMDDHEIELVFAREHERQAKEQRRLEELHQRQHHEALEVARDEELEELYEELPEEQRQEVDDQALEQLAEANRPLVSKNSIVREEFRKQRRRILRQRFSQKLHEREHWQAVGQALGCLQRSG